MKLSIKFTKIKLFSIILVSGFLLNSPLTLFGQNIGDELPKKGLNLKLENGNSLYLKIEESNFRIYFVDAENFVIKPPFDAARIQYENFRGEKDKKTLSIKKSSSGPYLTSSRRIDKPYQFWLRLKLLDAKDEKKNKFFPRMKFRQ